MTTKETIRTLLAARYGIIYVATHEEYRAQRILSELAKEMSMECWTWSDTDRLRKFGLPPFMDSKVKKEDAPVDVDCIGAIANMEGFKNDSMLILNTYHPFLTNPTVQRKLLDFRLHQIYMSQHDANAPYLTIVIIAPVVKVPIELEKEITILDMDLPNLDDITEQVNKAVSLMVSAGVPQVPTDEEKAEIVRACQGLTEIDIENTLARSWAEHHCLTSSAVLQEKQRIIRTNGLLEYYDTQEQFTDVGGNDALKGWLEQRAAAFSEKARKFGLPRPKGVMMIGIPGTGKTLIAKSLSSIWKMPLLRMDVGRLFAGLVGSSEENMRKALKTAEAVSPCILWIDEIEKALSGTGSSNFSDGGTTSRVFGTFLTWLQERTAPVFVVATANDVTQLPEALMRKGRFDEIFFMDLPTIDERRDIFSIHLRKRGRKPEDFDLVKLAESTEGYSGSEIEQVVIDGLFSRFYSNGGESDIDTQDLVDAAKETRPLSVLMKENVTKMRKWAEGRARFASSQSSRRSQVRTTRVS